MFQEYDTMDMICTHMSEKMQKTQAMGKVLFWSSALSEPLFTLYGIIAIILRKDLGASLWLIALMTCAKPIVSILSFYWSAGLCRSGRIKSNVLWAGFLMRAPFLLCPWFDSAGFVVLATINYTFFYRAVIPGWMEIIKRNIDQKKRGRLFSLSSAFGYAEGLFLAIGFGSLLDFNPSLWKTLSFGAALIGTGTLFIQSKILGEETLTPQEKLPWKEIVVRPWKDSWRLIRERPDFAHYLWFFMLSGFGLMLIHPALPLFAVDDLGVSYTMAFAGISVAKGLGFALSSPLWARGMERINLFKLASLVSLSFALFPLLMASSLWWIGGFYLAYFWYGIAQGGSHLIWHMSGPIFARHEESSRFSGVGLMMVGVRGVVGPPLGSSLMAAWGPIEVFALGGLFCLYSGLGFLRSRFAKEQIIVEKN